MRKLLKAGSAGTMLLALTASATASGPKFTEMGDAGSLPAGAQTTMGMGMMTGINGSMGMTLLAGGDFEDMYLINIVDPMNFRATTDPLDGDLMNGDANFNTQLWLFQFNPADPPNALGIVGNNDHPVTMSQFSLLLPDPTDGFPGGGVMAAGLYYLAITRFDNNPVGAGGEIFAFDPMDPFEISGPDGPGGADPIIGWTGDKGKFDGDYRMALQGVEYVPAPGALGLLVLAGLTLRRRRRR